MRTLTLIQLQFRLDGHNQSAIVVYFRQNEQHLPIAIALEGYHKVISETEEQTTALQEANDAIKRKQHVYI